MKKALLFDLDNTIYPVSAIADQLFTSLFNLLDQNSALINQSDTNTVELIKEEMTRRPFQHIADKYELDTNIRHQMLQALRQLTYDLPMEPFRDYHQLKNIPLEKFLVTTGFPKLQFSKIKQLGIADDFKEIIVVDPDQSDRTKKDIFEGIIAKYNYQPDDLLVIGDDPESEIKAGLALGIETFLFDPENKHSSNNSTFYSKYLTDALTIIGKTTRN